MDIFRRKKFVFEVRDLWPEGPIELGVLNNKFIQKASYAFEKKCYKSSSLVVTLSPGMKSHIIMPKDAPSITRQEVYIAGSDLRIIPGLISDAGKMIAEEAPLKGWFNVSTLKEPYRIEGKKTMGLEIAEQLNWTVPDVILYPTGGGVGLIGIYKALKELQKN